MKYFRSETPFSNYLYYFWLLVIFKNLILKIEKVKRSFRRCSFCVYLQAVVQHFFAESRSGKTLKFYFAAQNGVFQSSKSVCFVENLEFWRFFNNFLEKNWRRCSKINSSKSWLERSLQFCPEVEKAFSLSLQDLYERMSKVQSLGNFLKCFFFE